MNTIRITEYARQLIDAHGAAAEAEAAQKAIKADESGNPDEAEQWRRVRSAILQMKSAHVS